MRRSKRSNRTVAGLLLVMLLAAIWGAYTFYSKKHLNLLVINACSVNWDHAGLYGYPRSTTPNLDRVAENAFIFTNFITAHSWYSQEHLLNDFYWKVPGIPSRFSAFPDIVRVERLPYKEKMKWLRENVLKYLRSNEWPLERLRRQLEPTRKLLIDESEAGRHPFFLMLHFGGAHYPYAGTNRSEVNYEAFLSPASQQRLKRYDELHARSRSIPEALIPLFGMLYGDTPDASSQPGDEHALPLEGIVNNPGFLREWRGFASFADDVTMLREVYDAKLEHADRGLGDLLNLYGSDSLKSNTALIFVVDHGTGLMEHGVLHNGHTPYDELIRVPLVVRIPGMVGKQVIQSQFSEEAFIRLLLGLADGSITARNARQFIDGNTSPFVFSRNCTGTVVSVRWDNQWKYIRRSDGADNELYDLKADPKETVNLLKSRPDIVGMLEEELIRDSSQVERISKIPCGIVPRIPRPPKPGAPLPSG